MFVLYVHKFIIFVRGTKSIYFSTSLAPGSRRRSRSGDRRFRATIRTKTTLIKPFVLHETGLRVRFPIDPNGTRRTSDASHPGGSHATIRVRVTTCSRVDRNGGRSGERDRKISKKDRQWNRSGDRVVGHDDNGRRSRKNIF